MKTVDGDCSVEAGETQAISLIKELNVEKVEAMAGTAVKAGEPLFSYSAESLEDKMRSCKKRSKKWNWKSRESVSAQTVLRE